MTTPYDAIIVGARCAGAPTAMLLARAGHRVLVVDRATFPSDTVSTHLVQPHGVAALRRWGLLDEVAASGCPPIERFTFDFGPVTITGTPHPVDGSSSCFAPRRVVLDQLLVEAAAAAGAEVREGFTVDGLVVEGGTVMGIRGRDRDGRHVIERARVVIGADGSSSRVARAVGAGAYHQKPHLEWASYAYWSGLPVDGMLTCIRPDRAFAMIPTNNDLTLVLAACSYADAAAFKADVEGNHRATVGMRPDILERLQDATRATPFSGGTVPNFFRTPFGPGWALVGDAGYSKDPVTAQGISDGFRDAERVSTALADWFAGRRSYAEAMQTYQRERDEHALPMYELTTQLATLEPPPLEMQQLLGAMAGNQAAMDAFVSMSCGVLPPPAFFAPDHVGSIFAAAA